MLAGLGQHLAALDLGALNAAQQAADVVAGLALVERLLEHLDAGDDGLALLAEADDLDLVADLDHAALDAAGDHRAATLDAEHVLDRHQERLVHGARWRRDVVVDRIHQLEDRLVLLGIGIGAGGLERLDGRAADDRDVVAGEAVLAEQLAQLHLDQLQQLLVVHQVDLVQVDDHGRHFHLARQQDVLARLRHRAVGRRDHQDGAVHLGRAGDHVLDVVGVARAVHVGVVPLVGLVLDVRMAMVMPRARSSGALSI